MEKNSKANNFSGTCQKLEVPSDDEIKALNKMRIIKERVRELKQILADSASGRGDHIQVEKINNELKTLKAEWKEWKDKRDDAETVRMIHLGHVEDEKR